MGLVLNWPLGIPWSAKPLRDSTLRELIFHAIDRYYLHACTQDAPPEFCNGTMVCRDSKYPMSDPPAKLGVCRVWYLPKWLPQLWTRVQIHVSLVCQGWPAVPGVYIKTDVFTKEILLTLNS